MPDHQFHRDDRRDDRRDDQSDEFHDWAGAYTLGALDPDDRRRFERHLSGCARCADDVRSLAPIPGLLAGLDRDEIDTTLRPETADEIGRRANDDATRLRSSRDRWRIAAFSAAAAAIVAISGATIAIVGDRTSPEEPVADSSVADSSVADSSLADGSLAASVMSSRAGLTEVSTTERGWGTQIDLDLTELPARARYQLWAIDDDGAWSIAATWGPTPTGRAVVTGATSTPTADLRRLVVTSDDRDDVIVEATT